MSDSLGDYRAKRDFRRTPEPEPKAPDAKASDLVFVVHRHEARNLHYDLRLEMEGVLRSWAVPKGFSYDPAEKRLAVRTEDHPMEYEHFDGVIPKGEYGAGAMTIWDRGRYDFATEEGVEAVEKGEVKVILRGRRLRGEWHLVKTKQAKNSWLLFKSKDRYAGPDRDSSLGVDLSPATEAALAKRVKVMEAGETVAPFSDPEWLFEMQLVGRRLLAEKEGDRVRLRGLSRSLPDVDRDLRLLRAETALVDGVLVALDDSQRPSKERLEAILSGDGEGDVAYYAFDLLHYDDFDLRPLELRDRKAALRAVLPDTPTVLFTDHVTGEGEKLAEAVEQAGLPGLVAKRSDSAYSAGHSDDWRRVDVELVEGAADVPVEEALARHGAKKRPSRVKLTNLDKVFWPEEGYTKGHVVDWYDLVSDLLLPYLRDRPIHMLRYPDGIEGKSFYQQRAKEDTPPWVRTELLPSDSRGEEVAGLVCDDRDTLLWIANQGSIDMHPWASRIGNLDSPDWAVIDLDPKEAPFTDVVKIARVTGRVLRSIGMRPLLKTSGKTGIHVYLGIDEGYSYDQVRMFCEGVARVVVRELPDIATVERNIGSRDGRVYVDFGQNRRRATVVPPYVIRPRPGATVSAPLEWDELDSSLTPALFTIETMPERIERYGDLFRPALTDRQDLLPAIDELQSYLKNG